MLPLSWIVTKPELCRTVMQLFFQVLQNRFTNAG